ncbi:MAG: NAD(+) diphosphatase [Hespellia sp.]|nr:NAD(+) diphosphatase [Hespellia sp.]
MSPGWKCCPVTTAIKGAPPWMPLVAITAAQLSHWYQNHKYCSRCGHSLSHSVTERALECPRCQIIEYPKIAPVVIIAVVHEGKLLMTHYADKTIKPYVLIAGFVEIGESLEEAAQREVLEEVGLQIADVKYFGSQPWGLSDALATGFFATIKHETPIVLEYRELADARWFTPHELPHELDNGSLTSAMIEAFRNEEIGV